MNRFDQRRIAMYLLVIFAAAACLREPWLVAIQSAMGGFGLGYLLGNRATPPTGSSTGKQKDQS